MKCKKTYNKPRLHDMKDVKAARKCRQPGEGIISLVCSKTTDFQLIGFIKLVIQIDRSGLRELGI